ncbi:MAG: AAA family ATPase [Lachnospiraceae bacterium]
MREYRIEAIEETFSYIEFLYDIDLTDGPDSFLAKIFTRLFRDRRIEEEAGEDYWKKGSIPADEEKFRQEISFMKSFLKEAVGEELRDYYDESLNWELEKNHLDLVEETGYRLSQSWEDLYKEYFQNRGLPPEYGKTVYNIHVPAEERIQYGRYLYLKMAIRHAGEDKNGFRFLANRLLSSGSLQQEQAEQDKFYFVMENVLISQNTDTVAPSSRIYIRSEFYDAILRKIVEKYGEISISENRYVLEISLRDAFGELRQAVSEDAASYKKASDELGEHSVAYAWHGIAAKSLRRLNVILGEWERQHGTDSRLITIYGPYCLEREGIPESLDPDQPEEIKLLFGCTDEVIKEYMKFQFCFGGKKSEVTEFLEEVIKQNASCKRNKEILKEEYFYTFVSEYEEEERTVFDIDIQVVVNALVEKYDNRIRYVRAEYVGVIYTMEDIQYLGDAIFCSSKVNIFTKTTDDDQYICTVENCRFHNLFTTPLSRMASFREGSIWLRNHSIKMTFFFSPVRSEIREAMPKEEECITYYDGNIIWYDALGKKCYQVKAVMKSGEFVNLLPFGDFKNEEVLFCGMSFICSLILDFYQITSIYSCSGKWNPEQELTLYTGKGNQVAFMLPAKNRTVKALNEFLRWRSTDTEAGAVWDELIEYTNQTFETEEEKEFQFCYLDGHGSLKCHLGNDFHITYHIREDGMDDKECVKEVLAVIPSQITRTRLYLRLPYIYGYKRNYVSFPPIGLSLFFEDEGRQPVMLDNDQERLRDVAAFLNDNEWNIQDILGNKPGCRKNTARLIGYLCNPPKNILPVKEKRETSQNLYEQVMEILAKDSRYHMDEQIIRNICLSATDFLCWKFRNDCVNRKMKPAIPYYVFLGSPGSGKSYLVRKLAKEIFGAKYHETTPSELKGLYVGHTRGVFLDKIDELQNQKGYSENAPAILFLDEAYTLFQNQDSFSKDIIALLLTIMQHTSQKISYQVEKSDSNGHSAVDKTITIRPNTVIWMAGYEKEMRQALSSNPGIFRRVSTVVLPDPKLEDLWGRFMDTIQEAGKENLLLVEKKKQDILKFFRWGSTPEHAEFFGNYSGARRLAENMVNTLLLLDQDTTEDEKERELDYIIDAQKKEIRRQYQIVIRKNERLPFEVISDPEETLQHYIGNDSVREQMQEIVDMMVDVEFYKRRHVTIPKGALLKGCPGTGKTYLARCMAGDLSRRLQEKNSDKSIAFIPVAATELKDEKLISALFAAAEEYDSAILFIDEIDAIGRKRGTMLNDAPLIQLMKEMDGFDDRKTIFVLAATNAPEMLDPALKRAGRFDMEFEIRYPNRKEREELLEFYAKELLGEIRSDVLEKAGKEAYGCAPAQIRELINETALFYYRCENRLGKVMEQETVPDNTLFVHRTVKDNEACADAVKVEWNGKSYWKAASDLKMNQDLFLLDLKETLARKMIGERHVGENAVEVFQTEENEGRSATAIHEVGHALVYVWQKRQIEKVTVLARGEAAGYVELQKQSLDMRTKNNYLVRIKAALGGRVAEELFYGDNISTGACNDLYQATELARSMVTQYGMGNSVGLMALTSRETNYLGNQSTYTCSEMYRSKADEEVQAILEVQYREVKAYLTEHKEQLRMLAEHVFEQEEISGEDFVKKYMEWEG